MCQICWFCVITKTLGHPIHSSASDCIYFWLSVDGMTECFGDTEKAVSVTQTWTFSSQPYTWTFYFQAFPRNLKFRFGDFQTLFFQISIKSIFFRNFQNFPQNFSNFQNYQDFQKSEIFEKSLQVSASSPSNCYQCGNNWARTTQISQTLDLKAEISYNCVRPASQPDCRPKLH